MNRLNHIVSHIGAPAVEAKQLNASAVAGAGKKSPEDIVVVSAVRTAITRAKKGGFKDTHPTDLLAAVLKASVEKANIKPAQVNDILVGNVLAPGGFATQARMAMFLAGFPETTSVNTCNRQCSSGLQACAYIANAIRAGEIEFGIGAGVEHMTSGDMMGSVGDINEKILNVPLAAQCLNSMGQTSENVAAKYKVDRKTQDEFAVLSNARALAAQKAGKFKEEIVPVTTKITDAKGEEKEVTITQDEGPRATNLEGLSKLKPAFAKNGTTTAGNSSQVSDGAAAVVLTTRRKAEELKLPILGTFRTFAVGGVEPEIMGIGPAVAIPLALKQAGLTVNDIDVFEINEAFASQAVYCAQKLKISPEKLNPNGGAIALGHPLGCTGARQVATLLHELKRSGGRYGVISMCIGTGMGAAAVFEAEKP